MAMPATPNLLSVGFMLVHHFLVCVLLDAHVPKRLCHSFVLSGGRVVLAPATCLNKRKKLDSKTKQGQLQH